jgi:hypothetical protein
VSFGETSEKRYERRKDKAKICDSKRSEENSFSWPEGRGTFGAE